MMREIEHAEAGAEHERELETIREEKEALLKMLQEQVRRI